MPEPEGSRPRPPEGRDSHGERHPSGWRVRPGPDGRGGAPPHKPRIFGPGTVILLVLALNVVLATTLKPAGQTRVQIP